MNLIRIAIIFAAFAVAALLDGCSIVHEEWVVPPPEGAGLAKQIALLEYGNTGAHVDVYFYGDAAVSADCVNRPGAVHDSFWGDGGPGQHGWCVSGLSSYDGGESVVLATLRSEDWRFTLAHELAHDSYHVGPGHPVDIFGPDDGAKPGGMVGLAYAAIVAQVPCPACVLP